MQRSFIKKKMLSYAGQRLQGNRNEPLLRKFVINHTDEAENSIYNRPGTGQPFAAMHLFPVHQQPEKNSYE